MAKYDNEYEDTLEGGAEALDEYFEPTVRKAGTKIVSASFTREELGMEDENEEVEFDQDSEEEESNEEDEKEEEEEDKEKEEIQDTYNEAYENFEELYEK